MIKKGLFKVCAAVLACVVMLTACGTSGGNDVPSTTGTAEESTENENGDSGVSEITEFTIYVEDVNPYVQKEQFNSQVGKKITEQSGVKINTQYGTGDVSNQTTLMVADKNYPDFVYSRSNQKKFVEGGAFIDLAPLIEEHGPNIKKIYGDSFELLKDAEGHIYVLGSHIINNEYMEPRAGFLIQHDAVIDAGYPTLKTLDDLKAVVKAYVEKNPTTEDGQPTIGMTLIASDGWRWAVSVGNPAGYAAGFPEDGNYYVDPATYNTVYKFTKPEVKEYFLWLNGMYADGLLDRDTFTQTYDNYLAKIASGRVVALADAKWQYYSGGADTLVAEGKHGKTYGTYPLTINENIKYALNRKAAYLPDKGVGITQNCKDPIAAIKFLDYLCKDETQVLINWGIEGIHWEIKDGVRQWTPEEREAELTVTDHKVETGIGLYSNPWPCIGYGVKDASGQLICPQSKEEFISKYTEPEKDVLSHYNAETWMDIYPPSSDFEKAEWGEVWVYADAVAADSELGILQTNCNNTTAEYLAKLTTCAPEKFEQTWEEYQGKLEKNDVARLGELMTELVTSYAERVKGVSNN